MSRTDLITQTNLSQFFHHEVCEALSRQRTRARVDTIDYLVNLLTLFSRTDRLFPESRDTFATKPLALMYADAARGLSPTARRQALRRLGDFALFISGVFAGSLSRSVVDVDYYVSMGGAAYGQLSSVASESNEAAYRPVFDELATRFVDFVDVLGGIGEATAIAGDREVLRLYEIWLRTGSRGAERRLRTAGLFPSEANVSRAHH